MTLTPETIDAYEQVMTDPEKNGLEFAPLSKVFEKAEQPTAKHILYERYLEKISKTPDQLPKVIFYIVMDKRFQQGKTKDGYLGYFVTVK